MSESLIDERELRERVERVLARAGLPQEIRDVEAEIMVESDLLGVASHGVRMLPALVDSIAKGQVNPRPNVTLVRERGATALLDGDSGPGRYLSFRATQEAVKRARQHGTGTCLAANTSHWGRAHAYAARIAEAGMIGICTTNAVPSMMAWGSPGPLLGNNPLAIGVPRGSRPPVVLDFAMSQAAVGKIGTFLREGKRAPAGWGLGRDGQPTDDPGEILAAKKILPMGEHKGAGLSLMIELLTGALAGGLLCFEMAKQTPGGIDTGSTKLFLALDPEAFAERETFEERVDALLSYIKAGAGAEEILYPGERGWRTRDRNLAQGIPLHEEIVRSVQGLEGWEA